MLIRRKKSKGFTLVELLVVMGIIGILAAVIMSTFRSSQRRSRDAKRKSDLRQIGQALEMFYSDYQKYPEQVGSNIAACPYIAPPASATTCVWGGTNPMEDDTGRMYFRQLPIDTKSPTYVYYYRTLQSDQAFQLYTHLENPQDPNCINTDCSDTDLPAGVICGSGGSGACNFSITSTNVTPKD